MKEGFLMEQQLLEQVKTRINQLDEIKKQIKIAEDQLKESGRAYWSFRTSMQDNCQHVFYRIQKLNFTPKPTSKFHCFLCGKDSKEPQDFIGTVLLSPYSGYYINEDRQKIDEPFPIPPERQAEVDNNKKQLSEISSKISRLEEDLKHLRVKAEAIAEELRNVAHLLNDALGIPEIIVREPHRWSPDDFNYDPFE